MPKNIEEEFEKLAEHTSQEAARIRCSPSDYRSGLTTIIEALQNDLNASKEMEDAKADDEDFEEDAY